MIGPGIACTNWASSNYADKSCVGGSIQVEHFERWAQDARVKVMRPNTMNNYGAVLDDIGMEGMLNHLMLRYLKSMAAGALPWPILVKSISYFYFSVAIISVLLSSLTFALPVLAVLFLNVGGSSLDTHHGFVVEYAMDRDLDLGASASPFNFYVFITTRTLSVSFSVRLHFSCRSVKIVGETLGALSFALIHSMDTRRIYNPS